MNAKQKAYHKGLVQAVHVSKKYRAYYKDNKEEYKEVLTRAFGVQSSKDLNLDNLQLLVSWLNGRSDTLPTFKPDIISDAQAVKLRELWHAYAKDVSDTALLGFVKRVSKKAYLRIELVDKASATKAITALKKTLGEK